MGLCARGVEVCLVGFGLSARLFLVPSSSVWTPTMIRLVIVGVQIEEGGTGESRAESPGPVGHASASRVHSSVLVGVRAGEGGNGQR